MVAAWVSFGIQKHKRVNVSRHIHVLETVQRNIHFKLHMNKCESDWSKASLLIIWFMIIYALNILIKKIIPQAVMLTEINLYY